MRPDFGPDLYFSRFFEKRVFTERKKSVKLKIYHKKKHFAVNRNVSDGERSFFIVTKEFLCGMRETSRAVADK